MVGGFTFGRGVFPHTIDFFFRKSGFDRLKKSVNQDARIDFFFLKKIAQFYDYSL